MEAFVLSRMIARSVGLKTIIRSIASPMASGATIDCVAFIFIYKQEVLRITLDNLDLFLRLLLPTNFSAT